MGYCPLPLLPMTNAGLEYMSATEASFLAWLDENVPPEKFALWEKDYKKAREGSRECQSTLERPCVSKMGGLWKYA